MKITLFLLNNLKDFILPSQISGSFRFDAEEEEETKLINVEARDNNWVLYSTEYVTVIKDNNIVNESIIQNNTFYILKRNNINYLIYISNIFDNTLSTYNYLNNNINLVIGNTPQSNIKYNCGYLTNKIVEIKTENNRIVLKRNDQMLVYVNKVGITETEYYINNGDIINICALKIMFLPNMILINNPGGNSVAIQEIGANLVRKKFEQDENYEMVEVKDENLYNQDSYFSKSPRIRRTIETKDIRIDAPPEDHNNQEIPLLYTLGPMLSMGVVSGITLISTIARISNKEATLASSWPSLASGVAMLLSTLLWPILTRMYNKKIKKETKIKTIEKYNEYLLTKKDELLAEQKLQKEILLENLISLEECQNIIRNRTIYFWDKRIEQSDFLEVRIGVGNTKLDINVEYPEKGFTIEESDLKKNADKTVEEFKYIENVPIAYSFEKNIITAIMGPKTKSLYFVDNMLLQLITFYSYDDLKIVLFTSDKNKNHWNYLRYLNHCFDNSKRQRFFATNAEEMKDTAEYLQNELLNRISSIKDNKSPLYKPHYLIIIDDYDQVKNNDFIKTITEMDNSLGFSLIIIEKRLSKLPSKCVNFIQLGEKTSGLMENSYEKQECINFVDEVNYNINMLEVSKITSNVPIEFENGIRHLPESLTFMEMEKVGKVEQLNILNRWNTNNSTNSLKAEIGVDENGDYMYLDLHEKHHGPHGLIAGMTGSGKSEFIITYILSLAMNYSPDDVSFILIDYKGGGLAYAFENKATGVYLPHLAGTITNLDKAEMDRTLVSIDSEIKRRQVIFNEARDMLGESTIDIYKYQQFYKEGKLKEPLPHLLIICDEFAELKSQQPNFMDNLISVARIGRSLGIHLILATQKPSGVVNDQIWSNSKFKICLKVQDESDSKEMLKKPDAASLKQVGRFYLQVGYDEYFALGQSAWCGAKYYPSDSIVKQVDKSINFINNTGNTIKSIQSGNSIKIEAKGEQLTSILNNIIEVAKQVNKKAKRLWLENIDKIILIDDLIKKYNYQITSDIKAIIGEYDAPERQQQGLLTMDFLNDGNTLIFGTDSSEREMLLNTIIYSTSIMYTAQDINYYIADFGSESLRKFNKMPQVGDVIFAGEDEKTKNLLKLIRKELEKRKNILADYDGEYKNYIKSKPKSLPILTIILNNYDSLIENYSYLSDELIQMVRDSERYGIVFIITANANNSVGRRISQNFNNKYSFHLNDASEYLTIFDTRKKIELREITGRGLVNNGELHEFQTATLFRDNESEQLKAKVAELNTLNIVKVSKIPSLPEVVTYDLIKDEISNLTSIPIGITRDELEVEKYDFTGYPETTITANKLISINEFIKSLITVIKQANNTKVILVDLQELLSDIKTNVNLYINSDIDNKLQEVLEYVKKCAEQQTNEKNICIIYGITKVKEKLTDINKLTELVKEIKKNDCINLILCDDAKKLKTLDYDNWYTEIRNNTDGIWIGKGIADQTVFRLSTIDKDMQKAYPNDYGYSIKEGTALLMKVLEFKDNKDDGNNGQ